MSTPSYWATIVSQFLPHGSHSFTDHTMAGTSLWTYTWTRFSPQAWGIPDSFISQQDEVLVAPVTWVRGSWLNMFPSTGHSVCNTHFPQDKQPSSSADPTACNFWWGMWKICALPLPMSLAMSLRKWRKHQARQGDFKCQSMRSQCRREEWDLLMHHKLQIGPLIFANYVVCLELSHICCNKPWSKSFISEKK